MNALLARALVYVAMAGCLLSIGFGFGVNYANRDNTRRFAELEEKRQAEAVVVDKIVTKYVNSVTTKEVPVYVKSDGGCSELDGNFRMFFNSAASGKGLPQTPRYTDDTPVRVEDVARTTANNFYTCHRTADQLVALQEWAREVTK